MASDLLDMGNNLTDVTDAALTAGHVNAALQSLIVDGIFTGVGSVRSSFLPICPLFFTISTGRRGLYGESSAFVMDKAAEKSACPAARFNADRVSTVPASCLFGRSPETRS